MITTLNMISTNSFIFRYTVLATLVIASSIADDEIFYSETSQNVRTKRQSLTDLISTNLARSTTTPKTILNQEDPTDSFYHIRYVDSEAGEPDYWRDLTNEDSGRIVKHKSLQDAYRLAVKIDLKFSFIFYGHSVNSVTIATGGFLYMNEFLHSFLTATQYIAPLMANFNTSIGNESEILYRTDDDAFIVQWNNVYLNDQKDAGPFTFQVQLFKENGTIIASYKDIPLAVSNMTTKQHPVKVGLSDAFYWDQRQLRTIYPYHTYNATWSKVKANSSIIFSHKQTCNMLTDCGQCLNTTLEDFHCFWCDAISLCSSAYDRNRQSWFRNGCLRNSSITQTKCDQVEPPRYLSNTVYANEPLSVKPDFHAWKAIVAAICTIFALTAIVILVFIIYGYREPHSGIGQFLVRNRPSELWRKFKGWKDKDPENDNHMTQMT